VSQSFHFALIFDFQTAGWWQNARALDESPVDEYISGQRKRVFKFPIQIVQYARALAMLARRNWPTLSKTTEIARKQTDHQGGCHEVLGANYYSHDRQHCGGCHVARG
jgi:hypothetical protein